MLIVKSTMSEDVSRYRHDFWWDSADGESRFAGVTWCGCRRLRVRERLITRIKYKLSRGLMTTKQLDRLPLLRFPDLHTFIRTNTGCLKCGSVYIISIQSRKVVVTRFLNLSSASVLAAHLDMPHPESQNISAPLADDCYGMIPGGRFTDHLQRRWRFQLMKNPDLLRYSDIGPYVYYKRKYRSLRANLYQAMSRLHLRDDEKEV